MLNLASNFPFLSPVIVLKHFLVAEGSKEHVNNESHVYPLESTSCQEFPLEGAQVGCVTGSKHNDKVFWVNVSFSSAKCP